MFTQTDIIVQTWVLQIKFKTVGKDVMNSKYHFPWYK